MDLGVFLESTQGNQSSSKWGHARVLSSRAVAAVSPFPSRGSRDLWLFLEAFPRGFPTRFSHEAFPGGFPTRLSHRAVPRATVVGVDPRLERRGSAGKTGFLQWTETSGGSGNGGTTLEFLSPFLWRAPPLQMRRERREFFPKHAGKGSLLSS